MTPSRFAFRNFRLFTLAAALLTAAAAGAAEPKKTAPKDPPKDPPGGSLLIADEAVTDTPENYLKTIKHLVVSPGKHSESDFQSEDVAKVKALEDPLRRQIYDAMNQNQTDTFKFADLKAAQDNFDMRVTIVRLMIQVQKGAGRGGLNFNYYSQEGTPFIESAYWQPLRGGTFNFATRPKVKPSEAIDSLARSRYRGECLGCCQALIMLSARKTVGTRKFDELHAADGLKIKLGSKSVEKHVEWKDKMVAKDFVPGDWVYMTNKADYNSDLTGPYHGFWSGENCIYMGKYDTVTNFVPQWKKAGSQRYSGLGQYNKTEAGLRAVLKNGYLTLMHPPMTYHYHSIKDSDIKWDAHARLVVEK